MLFLFSDSQADGLKPPQLKIASAKPLALQLIQQILAKCKQIHSLPLASREQLQTANDAKNAWITQVKTDLTKIYGNSKAFEFFQNIAQRELRDSDPFEALVEQFRSEMTQRLERLRLVHLTIEEQAEVAIPTRRNAPLPTPKPIAVPAPASTSGPNLLITEEPGVSSGSVDILPSEAIAAPPRATGTRTATKTPTAVAPAATKSNSPRIREKIIMVLCSRNGTARQAICRFAAQMNATLEIIEYNADQPSQIIEQVFRHRDAKFAIVYWGEPNGRELPGSAHPERYVGYTLGFILGRLGRGRVFIMGSTTIAPLPGFNHMVVSQLDSGGGWQIMLGRRMKAAGLNVDLNKLSA